MLGSDFAQWAEPWARLGIFLLLWDEEAECIAMPGGTKPLWQMLMQHSAPFQQRLKSMARRGLQSVAEDMDCEHQDGCAIWIIPVLHRQRAVGTLLACGLTPEFFTSEAAIRFFNYHRVDRLLFEKLAANVAHYSDETLHAYAEILKQQVQSCSTGAFASRDVEGLSAHLAQAYEELNLIYRVSTNLTVLRRPPAHFEQLCTELLGAAIAGSFAAILEPGVDSLDGPQVIKAGPLKASSEDILRLYRQAQGCDKNARVALVVNSVLHDPLFSWAADWLDEFIFFELSRNDHVFGGLLAMNCEGHQEFGSQEVQLLHAVVERSSAFLENVRLYDDLEQLFMGMLHALVSSIDAKDPYTRGHSQRVAWLSRHIATLAGVPEAQCQRIYLSGLLHDIGKIGISEAVLRKPGRLSPEEFEEMKRHSEIGARILEGVRQVEDVIPGVLHHHERMDGKGYPKGLSGENIPFLGRVIGLADSFDAMTTSRTYRSARPFQIAAAEIRRCAGTQFDPHLVDLLLKDDLASLMRRITDSDRQPIGRNPAFASLSVMREGS